MLLGGAGCSSEEGEPCRLVASEDTNSTDDDHAADEVYWAHPYKCAGGDVYRCVAETDACGQPCPDCTNTGICSSGARVDPRGTYQKVLTCGFEETCWVQQSFGSGYGCSQEP